jgi:signal transduction histidine kinase
MTAKPIASLVDAKLRSSKSRLARAALIIVAYLFAFIVLDFISQHFEELRGIVAWYPPAGLTYALLLAFGVTFTPAVTLVLFFSSLLIYRMPQSPYLLFLWAFVLSLIYGLAAAFLRKRVGFDWRLGKFRDVLWFVFTAVLVSALLAIFTVSSSALSGNIPRSEIFSAMFHWWIGETVGVLSMAPFLLVYIIPGLKQFAQGQPVKLPARWSFPRPTLPVIGQISSLALTLYWVFGAPVPEEFRPLFLISLPLIWIALQHGFNGITAAIVALNFGVVLALLFFQFDLTQLSELQLLMIINCMVGLFMGAVVTDRKKAELALREAHNLLELRVLERTADLQAANLALEKAAHVKDEFLASINHELRTPLTGILGLSEVMQLQTYGPLNEKQMTALKHIVASGKLLLKLINDILDFSRIEARQLSLNIGPCQLNQICEASLQAVAIQTQQKKMETSFNCNPASIVIQADAHRLRQMLDNLINNAIKFTPPGGSLGIEVNGSPAEQLARITVWDTGIGIRSEDLPRLFQIFVQLDSSLARQYNGTGLGLALVQRLAELHDGSVSVQSQPGHGSRFTICLPW